MIEDRLHHRRLRVIQESSPSQIHSWEICERHWFWKSVEGIKDEDRPGYLVRGSHVDEEVQHYFRYGGQLRVKTVEIPVQGGGTRTEEWSHLVKEIVKHLPPPTPAVKIQTEGRFAAYPGGPVVVVKPDFLYEPEEWVLQIDDLKTIADFKRCKTREQLADDTQLVTYSHWGYEELQAREVRIAHVSACTKRDYKKPDGKAPARVHRSFRPHPYTEEPEGCNCPECKAWLSKVNRGQPIHDEVLVMSRQETADKWGRRVETLKAMGAAARGAATALDLAPSKDRCQKLYGRPCPYLERCGFDAFAFINLGGDRPMTMSLSERLQAMKNGAPSAEQPPVATSSPAMPAGSLAAHTHPGDALPADAGYKPGQPCNGKGFYASSNGQGFINVEPGHSCPVCNPAQIVPPDAPPRTSTPAEIQAVDEAKKKRGRPAKAKMDPEALIEAFTKLTAVGFTGDEVSKMHRDGSLEDALAGKITPGMLRQPPLLLPKPKAPEEPKTASVAVTIPSSPLKEESPKQKLLKLGFTDAQADRVIAEGVLDLALSGQVQPHHLVEVEKEEAAAKAPPAPEEPKVARTADGGGLVSDADAKRAQAQAQIDQAVESRRTGPRKLPPSAPVILVDAFVSKVEQGSYLARAVDLADWLAPVAELAAQAHVDDKGRPTPLEHWSLAPYGRGKGLLAAAIRETIESCPAVVLVDSSLPGADVFLEVVRPHAAVVVEPRGGRR